MVGVLAVVAILTAMLIPKIFETINTARINSTASAVNTVKTAVANHFAKYGTFADSTGVPFDPADDLADDDDADNFDANVLLPEGLLEKRFAVKIGDQLATNRVRVRTIETAADASEIDPLSANYDMDGVADDVYTNDGALVVECIVTGVSAADARALKENLDGSDITAIAQLPEVGQAATLGRVKYPAIAAGATGDCVIYIAHR